MILLVNSNQRQALADAQTRRLATAHALCQVQHQGAAARSFAALEHHLHTPSPYGRSSEQRQTPPAFSVDRQKWRKPAQIGCSCLFTLPEPINLSCVVSAYQAVQGQKSCPLNPLSSQASLAQDWPLAAIPSVNRLWSAALSAQARLRSHRAAYSRVPLSAWRATSRTVRFTRTNVTDHRARAGAFEASARARLIHSDNQSNAATALLSHGGFLRSAQST